MGFQIVEFTIFNVDVVSLRDLQYGLGETVFSGCRHIEYMNIWGFNEPK